MNRIETTDTAAGLPVISAHGELSDPVYSLLCEAVDDRATDVHLDPVENGKQVRFRIDGMIYTKSVLATDKHRRVLTQIKVAAGFNIDRSFVPKEGTITFEYKESGKKFDIRISLIPAGNGREAVHFRFLTGRSNLKNLEELGMSKAHRQQIEDILNSPTGIVLIGGITGSGKSSTMYSIASALDLERNVGVSIEDPIENYISGLRQIEVDYEHELTMHDSLRASLRMDPDAVFVGEIRDKISAITTARAGIAGRLVVATLHAPDPATAVAAMSHYEVPHYILSSGLRLIISQHLLRCICRECARERELADEEKELFARYSLAIPESTLEPKGCNSCRQFGYKGRTGVFELTRISSALANDIARNPGKDELLTCFREKGGPSAMLDALTKVDTGIISMNDAWQLYCNTESWRM